MKRIRPWLVFLTLQLISIAAVWFFSTEVQRTGYLAWFGIEPDQLESLESDLLDIRGFPRYAARSEVDPIFQCKPKTRPINSVKQNGVYKWVDAKGKMHFSDRPPVGTETENLSRRYSSRLKYFTVDVRNRGGTLPAYMKDHLSSDTRQIFSILSQALNIKQLRQVDLQVHVFDNKGTFNQFKRQIAPSLGNNISGFYNPGHNLAAVMRQKSDESTFSTARHEAAHVIISGLFGYVPTWFTEGIAEYFEQMSISGQLKTIQPNQHWIKLLHSQHRKRQLMFLSEYFQYDRQSWRSKDQSTMYAMAWSLTYFLMSSKEGKNLLNRFMTELADEPCSSLDSAQFFARNYRGGLQRLDQDWKRWLVAGDHSSHRY